MQPLQSICLCKMFPTSLININTSGLLHKTFTRENSGYFNQSFLPKW